MRWKGVPLDCGLVHFACTCLYSPPPFPLPPSLPLQGKLIHVFSFQGIVGIARKHHIDLLLLQIGVVVGGRGSGQAAGWLPHCVVWNPFAQASVLLSLEGEETWRVVWHVVLPCLIDLVY